jgi:hypothetical protein
MSTTAHFQPTDDLLHDISGAPHARESLLWTCPLPDEDLLVFAYAWRDGDTETYGRLIAVGGPDVHAPLVFDFAEGLQLEGENLDDCVIGGLRISQPEPLRVAEIRFESDAVSYEARFEALHVPFSWHQNAGGCPAWAATDRYEQSVRTSGVVQLGDEPAVVFSGAGHRDHSWGTRDWRALQHWKWMNATSADGEVSLHAWDSLAYGNRQVLGYVNRGGEVVPIRDIDVTVDLDDRLVHRGVRAVIFDEAGMETVLEATTAAGVQVPIADLYLNEIAMHATIDGRPAVAHVELGWPKTYVDQFA